jgi:hypothetical protein
MSNTALIIGRASGASVSDRLRRNSYARLIKPVAATRPSCAARPTISWRI